MKISELRRALKETLKIHYENNKPWHLGRLNEVEQMNQPNSTEKIINIMSRLHTKAEKAYRR